MGNGIAIRSAHRRLVRIRWLSWLAGLIYAGGAWYVLDTYYLPAFNLKDIAVWKTLIPAGAIGFGFYAITHWLLATIFVPGVNSLVLGETIEYKGLTKETTIETARTGDLDIDFEISHFAGARSFARYFIAVALFMALIYWVTV